MASYTVKAPDGKMVTLEGPEGASQEDIIAQAQALYKPAATPVAKPVPKAAPKPVANDTARFLQIYQNTRNSLGSKIADSTKREYALSRFDSDPRVQSLRKRAGLAAVSTREGDVKAVAKKSVQQRVQEAGQDLGSGATKMQSASAAIAHNMFGIPEVLAAAGERFLPSAITGNKTDASFSNILQMIRAKDKAAIDANPGSGMAGELGGGIVGVGGAGKLIRAGGERLAATGAPIVARVGRTIEELSTLRKGRKLANAGKLVVAGAGAGGAQAAGTGEDVLTGAAEGAVAAPVVAGGFKVAQVLTRPFRDVLRLSSAGQILSRLTTATRDALEARAAQYRAATGAEPTLFELLPLADRNKILKQAVVGKDNVVEQTSDAIRGRARNLGPEMSARARAILQPQRDFIQNGIRRDITDARGGQLAPGDEEMIANAMESPTDMLHLRDQEAHAIMAPHENTPVAANLEDVFPSVPNPNGGAGISTDPEMETVIRNVAGLVRRRAPNAGVTAGDITDMISKLRPMLGNGGNDAMVAERAINHLHDVLDTQAPDAGAAARQMRDAYAARSRMAEGMDVGHDTKLRNDIQVGTSRRQALKVRNAFDTSEGAAGRSVGQGNKVVGDLGGSPEEALRATVKQSRGSTGRELAQNIGPVEGDLLTTAARAQDESAQALASASSKAQSGSGDGADAEMLVQAIAGLHPSSFITTKAGALRRLFDMTYIPESRARTMIDMIFSQDPTMMRRALRAIGNEPNGATFLKYLAGVTGEAAASSGLPDFNSVGNFSTADDTPTVEGDLAAAGDTETPEEPDAPTVDSDSPYAPDLQNIYDSESPELLDLIGRVKAQESGGDQSQVSKAGAIGVMQIMPDTAPEAAALAGLPWDEKAYHNDATYNEILGIAYLSEQLRKYDGDVERALAAYNAGPDRTDDALSEYGENWLAAMPAETQDYVARVG